MQVPHNALVLVADGRKALFLRNEGDAQMPNFQVEQHREHPNPKDSDQKTDASGGASSTRAGPARHRWRRVGQGTQGAAERSLRPRAGRSRKRTSISWRRIALPARSPTC